MAVVEHVPDAYSGVFPAAGHEPLVPHEDYLSDLLVVAAVAVPQLERVPFPQPNQLLLPLRHHDHQLLRSCHELDGVAQRIKLIHVAQLQGLSVVLFEGHLVDENLRVIGTHVHRLAETLHTGGLFRETDLLEPADTESALVLRLTAGLQTLH